MISVLLWLFLLGICLMNILGGVLVCFSDFLRVTESRSAIKLQSLSAIC